MKILFFLKSSIEEQWKICSVIGTVETDSLKDDLQKKIP